MGVPNAASTQGTDRDWGPRVFLGGDELFLTHPGLVCTGAGQPSRIRPLSPIPRTSPVTSLCPMLLWPHAPGTAMGRLCPSTRPPPPPPRCPPSSPQTRLVFQVETSPLSRIWVAFAPPGLGLFQVPTHLRVPSGGLQPGLGAHPAVSTLLGQG